MSLKSLSKSTDLFPAVIEDIFRPWNELMGNGRLWPKSESVPSVNISEDKNEYRIAMAAPGLKKSDIKIELSDGVLTISSEKEDSKEEKESRYTRKEYSYSSFSRSFMLPEQVDQDHIDAGYENGVLLLVLPKKEESKKTSHSKHISVK